MAQPKGILPEEIAAAAGRSWHQIQLTREQIRAYFERRHPGQRIPLREKVAVRCAFHSEDNPSCTLFLDGNGGFNCHACGAKGNLFQFEKRFSSCSPDQAEINVAAITGATPVSRREGEVNLAPPVAIYDYRDENGRSLFQKRRYEPETGKKIFRIFHPADKGWNSGIDAKGTEKTRRILYNLPDLVKANLVFLCEGEKDCQNVMDANLFAENALSIAATTTFDGAWQQGHSPKWLDSYGSYFTGKQVVIFEDNDEPGRIYAATAAAAISKYALAVRIVSFPELPEGGDVSDYLAAGHTTQELEKQVKDAPVWTPPVQSPDAAAPTGDKKPEGGFKLMPIGELLARPEVAPDYLVDGLLICGTVSCVVSKPKVGKSTFARGLCLAVARGEPFVGRSTRQGACIYLALEERYAEITADFRAMGATEADPITVHADAAPASAILALVDLVRKQRPTLVVIDPLFRLAHIHDEKAYAEVYAALGPLIDLARETGTHILLTHHAGKSPKVDPIDSPLGSTAIGGAAATTIVLNRRDAYRTVQTVTRIGPVMPETVLSFDPPTRLLSVGGTRAEAYCLEIEKEILEYLEAGGDKTEPEIVDQVEGTNAVKRKALRSLVKKQVVNRGGTGRSGDPYRYSYSCTENIPRTSVQDMENGSQTGMDIDESVVRENRENQCLIREKKATEKGDLFGASPDDRPGGKNLETEVTWL
jgi:hypothetical protein